MFARKRSLVERLPTFVFTLICAAAALLGSSFLFLVFGLLAIGLGATPILLTLGVSTAAVAGFVAPIVILRRMRKQDNSSTPPMTSRDLHKPPRADRRILLLVMCILIAVGVALMLISIYYSEQSSELQAQ
jgi:hypothetical protein